MPPSGFWGKWWKHGCSAYLSLLSGLFSSYIYLLYDVDYCWRDWSSYLWQACDCALDNNKHMLASIFITCPLCMEIYNNEALAALFFVGLYYSSIAVSFLYCWLDVMKCSWSVRSLAVAVIRINLGGSMGNGMTGNMGQLDKSRVCACVCVCLLFKQLMLTLSWAVFVEQITT